MQINLFKPIENQQEFISSGRKVIASLAVTGLSTVAFLAIMGTTGSFGSLAFIGLGSVSAGYAFYLGNKMDKYRLSSTCHNKELKNLKTFDVLFKGLGYDN